MVLWDDWGWSVDREVKSRGGDEDQSRRLEKENRWRRAWILAQSRRAVRRWVQEKDGIIS
jgi:hypothetical protein